MKNYINETTNEIYAYESDGSQDAFIKLGLVPISDADLAALRTPTLPEAKENKLSQLTQAYATAIQQPVAYMDTTFQADTDSQQVLTASLAGRAVPADFAWLDINNVKVPMTFVQLQGLAGTMLAQGNAAFWKLQGLKDAVRAATTVAEVEAVVW